MGEVFIPFPGGAGGATDAASVSFQPLLSGILTATDVQGALDELSGMLPPPAPDCQSFLDTIVGLDGLIAPELQNAAQLRTQQIADQQLIDDGGLSQAEIDALTAEIAVLQAQIDVDTAAVTTQEADRLAASQGYLGCMSLSLSVGTTAQRQANPLNGFSYFDTTLVKPVWFAGQSVALSTGGWVDATGAEA